jgi:hypothetical protein
LRDTGILGERVDKADVESAIANYSGEVVRASADSVCTIQHYKDGTTENRLVARVLASCDQMRRPIRAFVFPGILMFVFALTTCGLMARFVLPPDHVARRSLAYAIQVIDFGVIFVVSLALGGVDLLKTIISL